MVNTNNKIVSFAMPATGPTSAKFTEEELLAIKARARAYIFDGGSLEIMGEVYAARIKELAKDLKRMPLDSSSDLVIHVTNLQARFRTILDCHIDAKSDYYQHTLMGRIKLFFGLANAVDDVRYIASDVDAVFKHYDHERARKIDRAFRTGALKASLTATGCLKGSRDLRKATQNKEKRCSLTGIAKGAVRLFQHLTCRRAGSNKTRFNSKVSVSDRTTRKVKVVEGDAFPKKTTKRLLPDVTARYDRLLATTTAQQRIFK